MKRAVFHVVIGAVLAGLSMAGSATEQSLERDLVDALRLKKGTTERLGDSGKAIQGYMREGFVNKRPNQRADYTDYYLLKKPARFMGYELVVIEEEYMSRHVGCCVNPGAGVTVKVTEDTAKLQAFARANGCTISDRVNLREELSRVGIRMNFSPGRYAALSCRERDAES